MVSVLVPGPGYLRTLSLERKMIALNAVLPCLSVWAAVGLTLRDAANVCSVFWPKGCAQSNALKKIRAKPQLIYVGTLVLCILKALYAIQQSSSTGRCSAEETDTLEALIFPE